MSNLILIIDSEYETDWRASIFDKADWITGLFYYDCDSIFILFNLLLKVNNLLGEVYIYIFYLI